MDSVSPQRTSVLGKEKCLLHQMDKELRTIRSAICVPEINARMETCNPQYTGTYVFTNDFPSLVPEIPAEQFQRNELLVSKGEKGTCRVVSHSPYDYLTLARMSEREIEQVIAIWQEEFKVLGENRTSTTCRYSRTKDQ